MSNTNRIGLSNSQKLPAPKIGNIYKAKSKKGRLNLKIDNIDQKKQVLNDVEYITRKLNEKLLFYKPIPKDAVFKSQQDIINLFYSNKNILNKTIKIRPASTLDDILEILCKEFYYIKDHSSFYAKAGGEITLGARIAAEVNHQFGGDLNIMSVRLIKGEFVKDSKLDTKESIFSYINKRDVYGIQHNTFSHGAEVGWLFGAGFKHEYERASSKIVTRATEGQIALPIDETFGIPVAVIFKIEYDHVTGDKIIRIAGNLSGKFGAIIVLDGGLESGDAVRIPSNK